MNPIKKVLSSKRAIIVIFILFAVIASVQSLLSGKKTYVEGGNEYNRYNNYTIFERSFYHLKDSKDLYVLYPEEHWDLYKYTPTFSVFFGIFAIFPDWLGLNLWNIFNALLLLISIYYLPKLDNYKKGIILIIFLNDLMTAMQNEQSNPMVAGLLVLAFAFLEKDKYGAAALCIVSSAYVKLFGIVGFALYLFYPKKPRLIVYSALWTVVLFAVPLLFVSPGQYKSLYISYWEMLRYDHTASYGYSVLGWLYSWFGWDVNKMLVVLTGAVVFILPLYKIRNYHDYYFKLLTLASILIWIVIFNHKAESSTYIIAMAGVSIWFMISKKNALNITLFILALVLTSWSPTDLFPRYLREEFVKPYSLKALPCILIWVKLIYDMLVFRSDAAYEKIIARQQESL